MTCIIDTCIILDYLLHRERFVDEAEKVLTLSSREHINGVITVKALADIHYMYRHYSHSEKTTRTHLCELLECITIIDSTLEDSLLALQSPISDYEDALIDEAAVRIGADYIVTRNINDFKSSKVKAILPEDFLKQLPDYSIFD